MTSSRFVPLYVAALICCAATHDNRPEYRNDSLAIKENRDLAHLLTSPESLRACSLAEQSACTSIGKLCLAHQNHVHCYSVPQRPCEGIECKNDGVCDPDTATCVCVDPWYGPSCESVRPGVCKPDPCKGDCKCEESCRHSHGYVCVSAGGYIGRNCTIPVPTLTCEPAIIVCTIPKSFYAEYDLGGKNSYIYMSPSADGISKNNSVCRAVRRPSGDYVINIEHPITQCGMIPSFTAVGDMVLKNKLWINKDFGFDSYDSPFAIISIQCTYKSHLSVVTSLVPTVVPPSITVTRTSQYTAAATICKISTCSTTCPSIYTVAGSAIYTVGQVLHLGIDVSPTVPLGTSDHTAVLQSASISCSRTSSVSNEVFIIREGCPTQHGIDIQASYGKTPTQRNHHICLSFRLPRSTQCSQIYMHVTVRVCHGEAVPSVCLQQNQRTLRCSSLHSAITKRSLEENEVVVGPFYLMDDQPGIEKVTFLDSDKSITIHTPSAVQEEALDKRGVLLAIGSGFLFILSLLVAAALVRIRCRISGGVPDRTG